MREKKSPGSPSLRGQSPGRGEVGGRLLGWLTRVAVEVQDPAVFIHVKAIQSNLHNPVAFSQHLYQLLRNLHALGRADLIPTKDEVMEFYREVVG